MKRFHFPFQRAMDWREHRAEQERSELDRLNGVHDQLQESRKVIQNNKRELSAGAHDQDFITSDNLHQIAAFSRNLHMLDVRLKSEETRCAAEIRNQRTKCTQADRDVKLLSHLHDRSRRAWEYESARELEQVAADTWNASYSRQLGREGDAEQP